MTWHLDDYRCTLLLGILRRSFQETSPRNTAENTAKHCGGGVGSVVANHRGGVESSVTVTTLDHMRITCISIQTDNHASILALDLLQSGCSS